MRSSTTREKKDDRTSVEHFMLTHASLLEMLEYFDFFCDQS